MATAASSFQKSFGRFRVGRLLVAVVLFVFVARPPAAAADDTQFWLVGRIDHALSERWAGQLLARFRFDDDVSRSKDFMLRNLSHWQFGHFDLGVGYDYLYSFVDSGTIEHRPFQTVEFSWQPVQSMLDDLVIKNRIRLDERFRADADGVGIRLRHRLRITHGLKTGWYLAVSNELFANLNDRGSGPPYGFEQNRLRFAPGRTIAPGLRAEFGYEWHVSAGRDRANVHRYILFFSFSAAPATYRAGRGD